MNKGGKVGERGRKSKKVVQKVERRTEKQGG